MKVFTNTNYATGKADGKIKANRFVGIDTTSGDVVQASAATVPIGVSHNFDTDDGCPVTVIPIGAGFARVKAGMTLSISDLGAVVGSDAQGRVITSPTKQAGILAGLSADVEGSTANAATDDDVVVLLTGVTANSPAKGTVVFTAKDGTTPKENVAIAITIATGVTVNGLTGSDGKASFVLDAGAYAWTAALSLHTVDPASGTVTVTAGQVTNISLATDDDA